MKNNLIKRAFTSTFYKILRVIKGTASDDEKVKVIGLSVIGFFISMLLFDGGGLSNFVFLFIVWSFALNMIGFFFREQKIRKRESVYRDRVKDAYSILKESEKIQAGEPVEGDGKRVVMLTNEDAYYAYTENFGRLKEGIQEKTENEIVSEVSISEELKGIKGKISDASFRINDIFNCPHYQVNPSIEDWLYKNGLPKVEDAQEKIQRLEGALEEFKNGRMRVKTGFEGELRVKEFLDDFEETMTPLHGVRFQSERGTVENDSLLFTPQGIFSLEVKNIGQSGDKKIKITNDGMWYEWKYNKWIKSDRDKIFDQVNRHTALTEKLLREQFGADERYHIKSIIVIPNTNVEIINESKFHVVRTNQLVSLIRENPSILTLEERLALKAYVASKDIGQGTFEFYSPTELVDTILALYESLEADVEFLSGIYDVQQTYVKQVNDQKISEYLNWKHRNMDTTRSVF